MSKRNVILADCAAEEVLSLAEGLNRGAADEAFVIESYVANWKRTGPGSELRRYATYFAVGFVTFLKRKNYRVILGWQQFYALIFCFFCQLFQVKKTSIVVALNYTYKPKRGKAAGIYRWFMSKCVSGKYLDYIHVLSEQYADAISKEFGFPRERIVVSAFGVNDEYDVLSKMNAPTGYESGAYALAIGRSNRDYDFLIRAWESVDYPLVIISDTYQGQAGAAHINILRDVVGTASLPWIANCELMVVPIDDGAVCSGDTVLLTAMMAERKILVTVPSTLAEMYVVDGENAVLSPKEEETFRMRVRDMLASEDYEQLGRQARSSFLKNFSRRSMGEALAAVLGGKGNVYG